MNSEPDKHQQHSGTGCNHQGPNQNHKSQHEDEAEPQALPMPVPDPTIRYTKVSCAQTTEQSVRDDPGFSLVHIYLFLGDNLAHNKKEKSPQSFSLRVSVCVTLCRKHSCREILWVFYIRQSPFKYKSDLLLKSAGFEVLLLLWVLSSGLNLDNLIFVQLPFQYCTVYQWCCNLWSESRNYIKQGNGNVVFPQDEYGKIFTAPSSVGTDEGNYLKRQQMHLIKTSEQAKWCSLHPGSQLLASSGWEELIHHHVFRTVFDLLWDNKQRRYHLKKNF